MKNNKLCVIPWLHLATSTDGDIQLCCIAQRQGNINLNNTSLTEAWNNAFYKQTRLDMLEGKEVTACSTCWKEEEHGVESHRIITNKIFFHKLGQQTVDRILESTNSDGSLDAMPLTIDFRLGNTCNLQCVMCKPADSSKWVGPAKKLAIKLETGIRSDWQYKSNIDISKFDWYKKQEFWNDFDKIVPYIKHITFGGGEPLLIREQKELIQRLVSNGLSKDIEMLYHTNGTIYDAEMVELWKEFKSVKIMLSIDGHGEVNDYIRRPSQWTEIKDNLFQYDQCPDNIIVSINYTVQIANIYTMTEFAQWLLDQNFKKIGTISDDGIFFASILHWPNYMSIQTLPLELKKLVTLKISAFIEKHSTNKGIRRFKGIIDFMNEQDSSMYYHQTLDYFYHLDLLSSNRYNLACTKLLKYDK